jgi:biopolymer transport protein ExbD
MPIQYRCPHCNQFLSIATRMAGRQVDCPTCGSSTLVPAQSTLPPAFQPIRSPVEESLTPPEAESSPVPADLPAERAPRDEAAAPARAEAAATEDGGFKLRRAQTMYDDMDLTPMVDVTFLLLIFFMITASFSLQKTIDFPPPNADQKGAAQSLSLEDLQDNTIFVRIDEHNSIAIDDEPLADRARLSEALTDARLATLRNEVAVDAHADALHETVVAVIDAATAAGMQRIRLVSRTGAGSK